MEVLLILIGIFIGYVVFSVDKKSKERAEVENKKKAMRRERLVEMFDNMKFIGHYLQVNVKYKKDLPKPITPDRIEQMNLDIKFYEKEIDKL